MKKPCNCHKTYPSVLITQLVNILADKNSSEERIAWAKTRLEELKKFVPNYIHEQENKSGKIKT
jgi:hypothetical protein